MPRSLSLSLALLLALAAGAGCRDTPAAAIAPGDQQASFHVRFDSPEAAGQAELLIRERLRAAGARSYQVWRSDGLIKVRVAAVRSAGDVEALLSAVDGDGAGPMAKFAAAHPYPSRPSAVRAVAHRDE